MNYKSREELNAKEFILNSYYNLLPNFNQKLKEKFDELYSF